MQIEKELEKYLGFLAQDENNLSLLENITALYLQLGNISEAQLYLHRALVIKPDDAKNLGLMALLYYDQGEEKLAKKYMKQSLRINPDIYEALLVDILLKSAEGKASIQQIQQLLQKDPEDIRLLFALGNAFLLEYDVQQAKTAFQDALNLYPDFYECRLMQAWCSLMEDNLEEAQYHYLCARDSAPDLSEGWAGLGLIAALKEDFVTSGHLIEKAQELQEDSYLSELAQTIFYLQSNPAKSRQHAEKVVNDGTQLIHEKIAHAIALLASDTTFIH